MPDLFTADIVCELSPAEQTALLASTPERGGFSEFLRDLQVRLTGAGIPPSRLVSDAELRRVQRYAYGYGSGGWQRSFRAVLKAAWRAGWVA